MYAGRGNPTSLIDGLSRVTALAYDARGLLSTVTDPASGVTTYGYDTRQRLTSLTDAESRTTRYTYDAAGRVLTETGPLGDVTTYQYDPRGLLQLTTTPKSEVIEYRYNPAGQLTDRLLPGGVAESYTYDTNGRLATAAGGGVTDTLAYDAAGRVTRVTDSRGYTVGYAYDAAGRRQTLTYPGGQVLTYGYDLAGRLTTLTDGPRTITLGYDTLGRRASLTHANGTQTTYAYDLASRLTGLTHATSAGTPLEAFTYGYNAADARTSLTTLTQSLGYGYDLANRLTGVTATPGTPIPSEGFTYDRVGNRLTGPSGADLYTYNAGHQLLAGPGTSYTYDANGNRATKTDAAGATTYTWDAVNRLVQAVVSTAGGTTTVSYVYDALGRRVRKTVATTSGGVTTTRMTDYVYDGEDILLAIETTNGGVPVTTRFVHGPGLDEPLLVEAGGQVYAVHADALGSVTGLSDGSQTLVETSTYASFGQLSRTSGVAGNVYAYTGREWEPELGVYYYRARYYDPEAGRFVSRDPIGFAGRDANLYGYVLNDPHNRIDPDGRRTFFVSFGAGGLSGNLWNTPQPAFGATVSGGWVLEVSAPLTCRLVPFTTFSGVTPKDSAHGLALGAGATIGTVEGTIEDFMGPGREKVYVVGPAGWSFIETGTRKRGVSISPLGEGFALPVGVAEYRTRTIENGAGRPVPSLLLPDGSPIAP